MGAEQLRERTWWFWDSAYVARTLFASCSPLYHCKPDNSLQVLLSGNNHQPLTLPTTGCAARWITLWFCNEEMISFVELDALQYAKSNDFSFSKELVRFVPDVLYCGARFIMGGKQTGEHTHALVSRRFCSAYCMPLMLLQAGVQGCMQVFKNSYTFTCLTQMVQSESIIVFTFSTYRHSLLL